MTADDLKRLAGVGVYNKNNLPAMAGSNISITGTEKAQLMKKHNIQPGTQEWFQLWFSKPYLTGEPPIKRDT
jgi:predicted small integral membrane protein